MLKILTDISAIDAAQWQALAATARTASWFQTREAVDFYLQLPKEMHVAVCAVEEEGELKGVAVAYVAWNGGPIGRRFTRRAIVEGGPMLADDISDAALEQLLSALREQLREQAIYIEIRNFEDYGSWRPMFLRCGFAYAPHYNYHVPTSSVAAIEEKLSKSRRRNIVAAQRAGSKIVTAPSAEQLREFYQILHGLYTRKVRTPLWSAGFFEKLAEQKNTRIILVEHEGRIVSGTACVCLPERRMYEWYVCGDDERYPDIYPSSFATYSAIRYAAEHGFERFDMMGAGSPDEPSGIREFKGRFGGDLVEYGRFLHVNKPLLYKIGVCGVKLLKCL